MIEKFFRMKIITAAILVIFWLSFSAINLWASLPKIADGFANDLAKESQHDFLGNGKAYIDKLSFHLNENVYKRYAFVEIYGFIQRLLGKNEENNFEVVMDEQGMAHYQYFGKNGDVDHSLAKRVARLKDYAQAKTKIMAIVPPEKDIEGYTTYQRGLPNGYYNQKADNYLQDLADNQVDALDLRPALSESGIAPNEVFFKTDHHWRVETAFWAYKELAICLQQKYGFVVDPFYMDKENWNFLTYDAVYLGSMGRKTGMYYSGVDDITLIYPKFNTKYELRMEYTKDLVLNPSGRFEETLLSYVPFRNGIDPFNTYYDKYASYLSGDYRLIHIVNEENPTGPKVLFIKDSIARPTAAFLTTMCSEVWLLDPRYYDDSMEAFISTHELDYIFVMFLPQDITSDFFPFGKTDEATDSSGGEN